MSLEDSIDDLGPLPKSDDNARLQRESFKALSRFLSQQDTFVFRDERNEDFGVDGSIELNISGQMTNFRTQIQVKSASMVVPNSKGYVAYQIESSNLNHLLNGTCPIYLLWDESRDEFWRVWAQDENRRLTFENPSWRAQNTVTLQFLEKFEPASFPAVKARILSSGRLLRKIHDSLARATEDQQVVFRIDANSLDITESTFATSLLLTSGTAIVAAGYPKRVVELMALVDVAAAALPRMQLTRGYAEYMLGNHWAAISHVRTAMMRGSELSAQDNSFLENLKDASELHIGLIDAATYEQRMRDRAKNLGGLEALQAEQDALYHQCVRSTDLKERTKSAKRLRAVTEQILNAPNATASSKLNAKVLLLFVEGAEANLAASKNQFTAEIRSQLYPEDIAGIIGNLREKQNRHLQWEKQAAEALREAYELNHPILIFEVLHVALRIHIGRLFEERFEAIHNDESFSIEPARKARIERMLAEAMRLNEANGSDEGKLKLDESRVDFLEVLGDIEGARSLAKTMYPRASAMGFDGIAHRARELLDGNTLLTRFEEDLRKSDANDKDVERAEHSDEQLGRLAGHFYETLGNPSAQYDIVLEHFRVIRRMARERVHWCRYLVMIEELSKTKVQETAYNELPSRKCECQKFGYLTDRESIDAAAVIAEFKATFCTSCTARDPKRAG